MPRALAIALLAASLPVSCGGSTGDDHVHFTAQAAGPADATGAALSFTSGSGYHVVLAKAALHIGGVYLNESVPTSGAQEGSCWLPGVYVAQVIGGVDVDLLSPVPVAFPQPGDGMVRRALAGEVWLTGGPIDAEDDATRILVVAGTADKDGAAFPFEGTLTIGKNRQAPASDPALPGQHPLCSQRIVSPIPVDLTLRDGATLVVRVDPRSLFTGVDFSVVPRASIDPPLYRFADAPTNPADFALFGALHARSGVYGFALD